MITCDICHHHCRLKEGQVGLCRARMNKEGINTSINYGRITSLALDPIEKKPLYHFYPKSLILSVGSFGCNFHCPFCQNCEISMADQSIETVKITPTYLVERALELVPRGNIGIAFTYNEPLIGYEFVRDCANLAKSKGLKTVIVTNGCISEKYFKELLPHIDAMNIDLKSFSSDFYKMIGGDLEMVKNSISLAAPLCHVEITTLIIPGENDSNDEIAALSLWLSSINPEIPLHITRFFPRYKMTDRPPTPIDKLYSLADTARKNLRHVYVGNI